MVLKNTLRKVFLLLTLLSVVVLLASCKKKEIKDVDYSGIWTIKREIIIVGGTDTCKYNSGVVFVKLADNDLSFSLIYKPLFDEIVNQETLNSYKNDYVEDFKKIIKIENENTYLPYDTDESIITGVKLSKIKITNNLIELTFLNDLADETILVSEVYILLKRTKLSF